MCPNKKQNLRAAIEQLINKKIKAHTLKKKKVYSAVLKAHTLEKLAATFCAAKFFPLMIGLRAAAFASYAYE